MWRGRAARRRGGHEAKQADKDRGAGVTDAAVVALGAVAGALPWMQYQQLLGQHLRLMKRHAGEPGVLAGLGWSGCGALAHAGIIACCAFVATVAAFAGMLQLGGGAVLAHPLLLPLLFSRPAPDDDSSKALIRSVCVILDAFHFPLPTDADAEAAHAALPAGVLQPPKQQQQQAAEPMEVDGAAVPAAATGAGEAAEEGAGEAADADAEAAEEEEEEAMEVVEGSGSRSAAAAVPTGDVYRLLSKRVVPELQRIMVEKDTVRAPVALAGEQPAG